MKFHVSHNLQKGQEISMRGIRTVYANFRKKMARVDEKKCFITPQAAQ